MQSVSSRFWSKVKCRQDGVCWPWTGARLKFGYGRFWLGSKEIKAHRMAWILAHGSIPDGLWVLHHCDNPPCVNPKHLFVGTRQDNEDDKYSKGRGVGGARNGRAVLSEAAVVGIRNCIELGVKQATITEFYSVEKSTLSYIVLRKSWKHI